MLTVTSVIADIMTSQETMAVQRGANPQEYPMVMPTSSMSMNDSNYAIEDAGMTSIMLKH